MGLVQRVISCLMYGNGCSKQVCIMCLTKSMIFDLLYRCTIVTNDLPLLHWNYGTNETAGKNL